MSWIEDEGYDSYDFDYDDNNWNFCEKCESSYPPNQEFCYVCLSDESKWRLGVL